MYVYVINFPELFPYKYLLENYWKMKNVIEKEKFKLILVAKVKYKNTR